MQFLIACLRLSFPQTAPQDEAKLIWHLQGNTEDSQEFRRHIFINGREFCNVDLFATQKGVAINFYCVMTFQTMLLFPACHLLFQKNPNPEILISD